METIRAEMNSASINRTAYRSLLQCMAQRTVADVHHLLTTTNWDYLAQSEVEHWMNQNRPGYKPPFLVDSMVYHFNGSAEPGEWQNRSPMMLETDRAEDRKRSFEANQAFNQLLWSRLIVIVGMSFECDVDRGLLGALGHHEDDLPIGNALFVVVDPNPASLDRVMGRLASQFPRAGGIKVNQDFARWVQTGMPQLDGRAFSRMAAAAR